MNGNFKFIDHTADIAVELTGNSLQDLFDTGAKAWIAVITENVALEADDVLEIELSASSREELLVSFLNELNYLLIAKKWLFLSIQSIKIINDIDGVELSAELKGKNVAIDFPIKNEIKSVTYHQVEIVEKNGEYSTLIVFDI